MAAVPFPLNPNIGQVYTYNGLRYIWDGRKWVFGPAVGGGASQMPTGPGLWAWNGTLQQWVAVAGGDMAAFPTTAGNWVWNGTSQLWVPLTSSLLRGVTDGSNAGPGMVGEVIFNRNATETQIPIRAAGQIGGPINLNNWTTICQLTLTPGDWDVDGDFSFDATGGTTQPMYGNIHINIAPTGTNPAWPSGQFYGDLGTPASLNSSLSTQRQNVTVNTTLYLCASVGDVGNQSDVGKMCYVGGTIYARRMR